MVFSSFSFLWIFLPLTLVLYFSIRQRYKNGFLVLVSFIFYGIGGVNYIPLILFSIVINYFLAFIIQKRELKKRTFVFSFSILFNLLILGYFKYFNFFATNINAFTPHHHFVHLRNIILPLGISFYTFHIISYLFDVYRRNVLPQQSLLKLTLYISFFPQLIAGPIIKYHDIHTQLQTRRTSFSDFTYGVRRFIYGLSKKVLIANTLGYVVDTVFALPQDELGTSLAWLGIICYMLQIYFDFSGYSDMAIGLACMFGFHFMENFNFPYLSKSIREFWQRWHISLSTWFREYLYIPLGGNRKGKVRTYFNLMVVFLLTGLWHGASFNFVIWGAIFGVFLVLERMGAFNFLQHKYLKGLALFYTLFVVLIAWVFFRSPNLAFAIMYLKKMFIYSSSYAFSYYCTPKVVFVLVVGVLFSGFLQTKVKIFALKQKNITVFDVIFVWILGFLCLASLTGGNYNPFIYFRF